MNDLRGKRALVMGLGVHGGGLGVTRFLVEQGAQVTVTDLRNAEQLAPTLAELARLPVRYVLGEHREADFREADLVIRNPGVPRESRFLEIARAAGAAIEMEMTLFFRLCPGPILGITGTKGKTTTTLLTGAMLREQFPDTVVAGNLRVSALEQLPRITARTPVVLELSSWQLEGLGETRLSPQYACITNLSPDHLDRYGSMADYQRAKEQIWLHQRRGDVIVLNANDERVSTMAVIEFEAGNVTLFADDDPIWQERHSARYTPRTIAYWRDGALVWQADRTAEQPVETICTLTDVQLPGRHNLANIAAAAALAKRFGVTNQHIRRAIRNFRSVPDRMEPVRELDGVRYINDTTATTPTAACAALRSIDAPTIVLAGGADKQLPFADLAHALLNSKAIVLLEGSATPALQAALDLAQRERREHGSDAALPPILGPFALFEPAVRAARELAAPGDVVLLSPGCASFGMFRNEFERGAQFRQIVQALP